jgi:hypothetical protein
MAAVAFETTIPFPSSNMSDNFVSKPSYSILPGLISKTFETQSAAVFLTYASSSFIASYKGPVKYSSICSIPMQPIVLTARLLISGLTRSVESLRKVLIAINARSGFVFA